jgi:cytidylate kinase
VKKSALIVAGTLLALALLSGRTSAQAPQSNDVNAAIVRELHDLRLAIEKLASANSLAQAYSARAAQEGQLISTLTTQLIALNGKLAESQADLSLKTAVVEHLKDRIRAESDPKQRTVLEEQQNDLAVDLNQKRILQSALQAQVDAVRQQILAEQRRLDELDRWLADSRK